MYIRWYFFAVTVIFYHSYSIMIIISTNTLPGNVPSSSDEPMMPRLSCSQRTTAPAMATDPCEQTQPACLTFHSVATCTCAAHFGKSHIIKKKKTMAGAPPVHSKQACPGPVCRPQWSAGRDPTSPAERKADAEAAVNPKSGATGTRQVALWREPR